MAQWNTPQWLAQRGFVLRAGQQFYADSAPEYVWRFEDGDPSVRVSHVDGAVVRYPVGAFDYIVVGGIDVTSLDKPPGSETLPGPRYQPDPHGHTFGRSATSPPE